MRKLLVIAIPLVILSVFLAVMSSGFFLKNSIGKEQSIPQVLSSIISEVEKENWREAGIKTGQLEELWRKVTKRIQFSLGNQEIKAFNTCLSRLKGAIAARDREDSLLELYEANEHWSELGK